MACGARMAGDLHVGTRKPVTIVFTDVADSTGLAERHEPETVRRVLSRYFEVVSRTLQRHGGTVEKFIGDAVMAVFGVPIVHEDHALRAVKAAAELTEALEHLNEELERDWGIRIEARTGINSGEVVAGDPAGGQALVTGDAVNVAARLEQAAAAGETLIGDQTRLQVGAAVELEHVEPLSVKGKEEPVGAWRLVGIASTEADIATATESPMLGRDPELRLLKEVFEGVAHERRVERFTVLGPAGIGKSRLALELRGRIAGDADVLIGRCLPYGEGITFWPLAEIVHQAAGEDPGVAIADLFADTEHAEHAGLIAERVSQAVGLSEGSATREDLQRALRMFFEALARRRPLVLVFEDLHWAEEPLLDFVEQLSSRARDVPLMLLCLAREELIERRPGWTEGSAGTLTVEALSADDANGLVSSLLADVDVSDDVRKQLLERAQGNPLFIEQMLALLREEGEGAAQLSIPPTIQALLAARLDRLSVTEQAVVGAASVVGKEFWRGAVVALSRRHDPSSIDHALAELERRQLIGPEVSSFTSEQGFAFRHILIRDAAYEGLMKSTRAELHETFGSWLEDGFSHRLIELEAILGFHFEQAYNYRVELSPGGERHRPLAERAAARLASAGRRSARAREDATAANLLGRASRLFPQGARERLVLLPLVAEALEGTANHARAGELYAEAIEGALAAGERAVEGRARHGRAHVWFVANPEVSTDEIAAETEQAIEILEEVGDERGLAEAWRLVGEARVYQGRAAEGLEALERALTHVTPETAPRSWNALLFAIGMCRLDGPAPLAGTVAYAQERLEFARARELRALESDMLHVLGAAEGRMGRFDTGRRALSESAAISQELGLAYMAQWSRRSLGQLELAAGDAKAAERALRESEAVLIEMGLRSSLGETVVPLAAALLAQGRYDDAAESLRSVKEEWASGDASVDAPRLALRAKLLANEGLDVQAERAVGRSLRLVEKTDWVCLQADTLLAQAEILRLADRLAEAAPGLRRVVEIAEAKGYAVALATARGLLDEIGVEAGGRRAVR
jgi:class 3 adenylate cyclase/tetratricopeptide (TPR) repeat protein